MKTLLACLILLASPSAFDGQAVAYPVNLNEATQAIRDQQFARALELLDPVLRAEPRNVRAWTAKGLAEEGLAQPQKALESFRKALSVDPGCVPALEGAAQIEYQTRDPLAQTHLEKIAALEPHNGTAHAMLGALAFERKDCANAVRHFDLGGDTVGRDPRALWELGYCAVSLDRGERAESAFRTLLEMHPADSQLRYDLGVAQLLAGHPEAAISTLQQLASGASPDLGVLNLLAQAYEANHQTDEAVAALRKAVAINPRDQQSYLELGSLCMDHGAFTLGIEIVDAGLRNLPEDAQLYTVRGILRAQTDQYREAEADFERANQLAPAQVFGTLGLGITFLQQDKAEESVRVVRERLASSPGDPMLNYFLAEALLRKGVQPGQPEFEETRRALQRCLAAKPDFAPAHARLGKLLLMAQDTPLGFSECERAFRLAPTDRMVIYQYVQGLRQTGRNQEVPPLLAKLRTLETADLKAETDRNRVRLVKGPAPASAAP